MERMTGFEPATSTLARLRSSQLSYIRGGLLLYQLRVLTQHHFYSSRLFLISYSSAGRKSIVKVKTPLFNVGKASAVSP